MSIVSTGARAAAAPMGVAPGYARSHSLLRFLPYTDLVTMFGWVVVSTLPFGNLAPLRYLFIAYFIACTVLFARQTLPTFIRGWPTLIIPILCVISAIWAPSVGEAIRKGLFMFLTAAVAVYAASRLSVRQILMVYAAGEFVGALLSAVSPNLQNGAWTGVFGQKNHLAVHMFILFTTSFALLLDTASNRWVRWATLMSIPLAAGLIVLSKSATTIMLMGAAGVLFLGHAFLWQPAIRIRHMRTLMVFAGVLLASIAGLVLFGLFQFDAMDTVLKAFGKDSTLTGRTFIWDWGHRIMAEHPWTGVGANGFWRPEVGIANQIEKYFFYEQFVKFSFHNSYLENGVQLGYPGYYATIFMAGWALIQTALTWLRNQSLLNAAFLILAIVVIIRTNSEPDLGIEFAGTMVLLFIGAMRTETLRKFAHVPTVSQPPLAATPGWTPPEHRR